MLNCCSRDSSIGVGGKGVGYVVAAVFRGKKRGIRVGRGKGVGYVVAAVKTAKR
jgi:hypothetical protein